MSGVKRGGTDRLCVQCIMKKNGINVREPADNRRGTGIHCKYSASKQLQGKFELLFMYNNEREAREEKICYQLF